MSTKRGLFRILPAEIGKKVKKEIEFSALNSPDTWAAYKFGHFYLLVFSLKICGSRNLWQN
jgi:hypothetical protein